jgi:dihydroorotate dehydrogenase
MKFVLALFKYVDYFVVNVSSQTPNLRVHKTSTANKLLTQLESKNRTRKKENQFF